MSSRKYTIILPVRNGGEHLKLCVHSILAQTIGDFELAVLENCSTDGSAEWVASLNDPRIKLYPAAAPLSIQENWARAVETPKNEFVTLIGHDDVLDPNYLEVIQDLISREPNAGLYQTHFRLINENGDVVRHCTPQPPRQTAAEWLTARLAHGLESYGTGYMMRAADYDAAGGIPPFERLLFADDALWITLMRRSGKATAPQECFSYRLHTASAGATADVASWLTAMNSYISFWEALRKQDTALAVVYDAYGPAYFYDLCYSLYMIALRGATTDNRRLKPSIRQAVLATLARVSPQTAQRLSARREVRLHETLNSNVLARQIYRVYATARYGHAS